MGDTRRSWALGAIALLAMFVATAATALSYPDKPPRSDYFVDEGFLLDADASAAINETAAALLREEQIPIFVVTISSLSAYDASGIGIEAYATKLFNHWGIGREDRNYGILLLVAVMDRKARIELGAGFGRDYDAQAREIMQSLIIPAFKRNEFALGLSDGVRGLDAMARGLQLPKPTPPAWFWPAVIAGALFLGFAIFNLFKTGRSGWAWALIALIAAMLFFALRNSAGSAGGFGGGSSGGGGATGSW